MIWIIKVLIKIQLPHQVVQARLQINNPMIVLGMLTRHFLEEFMGAFLEEAPKTIQKIVQATIIVVVQIILTRVMGI